MSWQRAVPWRRAALLLAACLGDELPPDRPHILLLMTDQQRVDSLTAYRTGTLACSGGNGNQLLYGHQRQGCMAGQWPR